MVDFLTTPVDKIDAIRLDLMVFWLVSSALVLDEVLVRSMRKPFPNLNWFTTSDVCLEPLFGPVPMTQPSGWWLQVSRRLWRWSSVFIISFIFRSTGSKTAELHHTVTSMFESRHTAAKQLKTCFIWPQNLHSELFFVHVITSKCQRASLTAASQLAVM